MRNRLRHIVALPRNLIVLLITGYQHTLSPDHGPLRHLYNYGYCRHSPTCSEYTKQQVIKHGALIGTLKGLRQLLTCHPWKKPSDKKISEILEKNLR